MALPSFIFGGDTGITYDDLQRRRKVAEAMMARHQSSRTPRNVGEGLSALGDALGYRFAMNDLAKAEKFREGKEGEAWGDISSVVRDVFGGNSSPGAGTMASAASAGNGATGSQSPGLYSFEGSASAPAPDTSRFTGGESDLRGGIIETASALGIDPVDLATAISYETAGTFDPTKAGPTTQWGQHRGLIQFGEPQAQKYGVNWDDPIGSQLGADGAVAKYLRDTGVQPGMGLLDIYSAINAGGVGKYDASDANNGGAPGTVRDKVEQQMAGHRAKAMALIGEGAPSQGAMAAIEQQAPVQVASLDQSAGMDQAIPAPAPVSPGVQQVAQAMGGQMAPGQEARQEASRLLSPDPLGRRGMVAQALVERQQQGGGDPWTGMRQASPGVRRVAQVVGGQQAMNEAQGGAGPERLMQLLQNPWLSDTQRKVVSDLLERQMQRQQSSYENQIERQQLGEQRAYDERQAEIARQNDLTDYRRQKEIDAQFAPAPPGYRRTSEGGLEAIPGGPHDPAANFRPEIETIFDESGRERKGYFDQNNQWVDVGGAKAPSNSSGMEVVGPDGTRIVINGKLPSGFIPDPETPGAIMPIPGGPAEQISGELAARLGMAENFLDRAPVLRERLASGEGSGLWDVLQARNNQSSSQAEVHRELEFGVEALVRMLTGAGMPESEARERTRRYLPTYTDDSTSMVSKLDGLTDYLRSTRDMAMRGRGGRVGDRNEGGAGGSAPDPLGIR